MTVPEVKDVSSEFAKLPLDRADSHIDRHDGES